MLWNAYWNNQRKFEIVSTKCSADFTILLAKCVCILSVPAFPGKQTSVLGVVSTMLSCTGLSVLKMSLLYHLRISVTGWLHLLISSRTFLSPQWFLYVWECMDNYFYVEKDLSRSYFMLYSLSEIYILSVFVRLAQRLICTLYDKHKIVNMLRGQYIPKHIQHLKESI